MELDHYIPGRPTESPLLLGRYYPRIPANVARVYIEAHSRPGDLILDPFAQSPAVIREAVACGRRIVAANANPIVLLVAQGSITPPAPDDLDALTTRLGDSPKLGQTLRQHLEDLYRTRCPHCARPIIADYFVWEQDPPRPVEKVYRCQACGGEQREPVDQADGDRLATIEARGFHYHFLLERLAGPYDEHRSQAQKLLDLYTPRNLYALANLTMKVETMFPEARDRQALSVVLLACLDACSKLNTSPWDPAHPGRLRPPPRFVELNVWWALETVRQRFRQQAPGASLTLAQGLEEVTDPGTGVRPGALALVLPQGARSLAARLAPASVQLVLTTLPPLDPTFYRLSFLWTGWLYGRKAAAGLEPLLKRRSQDWSWFERGLSRALAALRPALGPDSRLVFISLTDDPSYLEALLMAASRAALSTENIVYQPPPRRHPSGLFQGLGGEYRVTLRHPRPAPPPNLTELPVLAETLQQEALAAAEEVLHARAEPLAFDWLHLAAWQRLSQTRLPGQTTAVPDEGFDPLEFTGQQVRLALEKGLAVSLVGLGGEVGAEEEEPKPGHWWLAVPGPEADPLSDRVEQAILEKLRQEVWVTEEMAYQPFPGLLTPPMDLLEACLRAYGAEPSPGVWQLRPGEVQEIWDRTSREMVGCLVELGRRLGYRVLVAGRWDGTAWPAASTLSPKAGAHVPSWLDVLWLDDSQPAHAFAVRQMALLGFLLAQEAFGGPDLRRYIVLPEERAELIRLTVTSSPLLRRAVAQQHWDFIKFRPLRRLVRAEAIERHHLRVVVGLDPIMEQTEAQIPLF